MKNGPSSNNGHVIAMAVVASYIVHRSELLGDLKVINVYFFSY